MSTIQRPDLTLDDRWTAAGEATVLTGIQALVRVPLLRRELDRAAGWRTAGFVSGYRGSPLGSFDKELLKQAERLTAADVVFQPGLNEDLAATACWGTQQVNLNPGARFAGVFALWYGKGPGVDRSGDVFRHANSAGTAPRGGVLALAGDDPTAKSSTVTNASEFAFMDAEMPVLDPADVAEVIEFGVKGIALSRAAGLWVGMKCVADTMDAAATVRVDPAAYATLDPELLASPDGLHIRLRDTPIAQERRLRHFRLPAAIAFARANALDRVVLDSPVARFGIAARGKAYAALRQALLDAGITDELARILGLRVWKVGLAWPLDAVAARAFATGLEEVLVVEDRRPLLEPQLRDALYALPTRPRISGKRDDTGAPLLSDLAELDAAAILRALAARLPPAWHTDALRARLAALDALARAAAEPLHQRDPHFCPGCPHNTSTKVPEGSRALAGIGCHYLAHNMDRASDLFTQMGGEGTPWLGQAPFVEDRHIFANLGDGTYGHSGSLAIRAAVAAQANMTFKLLYNGAVAMTGGQVAEGEFSVPRIAAQLAAEGVARIDIVSDEPDRHGGDPLLPAGVRFHHRRELDAVQRALRETPGVTAIIYDQACATERRRKRKRDLAPAASRRAVINPRVCEDCGDCSRTSNCLAVEPVETPFGRKRRIDQSACNSDLSCVDGFCPSFVTLVGATPAAPPRTATPTGALPDPTPPALRDEAWNILLAGVGGGGVTALSAILGMAAHLEGRPMRSTDQLGLAQKGGGVYAQLRIGAVGATPESIPAPRIGAGGADLLLAADMMVAHGRTARPLLGADRTAAVLNTDLAPTAQFVLDTATTYDLDGMVAAVREACRDTVALPAATRVVAELGDAIHLNVWLLGVAYQRGLLPLSAEAIGRAIELNGAQVARNGEAFARGRAAALEAPATPAVPETLDSSLARRVADLTAYQNARYARAYADVVARVRAAEAAAVPGATRLTAAVVTQLYRLMAYKDEYEVARLHADPAWRASLAAGFTGARRVELNLAPPLLTRRDPVTGVPRKIAFGPWIQRAMTLLRHGKRLRGTPLDPFGHTGERRTERALIAEYRAGLDRWLARLTPTTHAAACDWAEAAAGIKGFGHVKARNLAAARARMAAVEDGFVTVAGTIALPLAAE